MLPATDSFLWNMVCHMEDCSVEVGDELAYD